MLVTWGVIQLDELDKLRSVDNEPKLPVLDRFTGMGTSSGEVPLTGTMLGISSSLLLLSMSLILASL